MLILATVNYFDCRLLGLDGLNFQIYFISHVPMVGSIAAAVIIVAVASLIIKNKQEPREEKNDIDALEFKCLTLFVDNSCSN